MLHVLRGRVQRRNEFVFSRRVALTQFGVDGKKLLVLGTNQNAHGLDLSAATRKEPGPSRESRNRRSPLRRSTPHDSRLRFTVPSFLFTGSVLHSYSEPWSQGCEESRRLTLSGAFGFIRIPRKTGRARRTIGIWPIRSDLSRNHLTVLHGSKNVPGWFIRKPLI